MNSLGGKLKFINLNMSTHQPIYKLNILFDADLNSHLQRINMYRVRWNREWGDIRSMLSLNPNGIHLLKNNVDRIDWHYLSKNPNAIHLLEKNLDKVNWTFLSKNPNAIHLLEKNLDKVSWFMLSMNPNAIHILEKILDKVDWC